MSKVQPFGFGERLREARVNAKLTQTELAAIAGENGETASKQAVSGWEAERHYPKANQLRAICIKLNISADDLLLRDITEGLKIRQAEEAVKALTPSQKQELLRMMSAAPADDGRVAQHFEPAPKTQHYEADTNFQDLYKSKRPPKAPVPDKRVVAKTHGKRGG